MDLSPQIHPDDQDLLLDPVPDTPPGSDNEVDKDPAAYAQYYGLTVDFRAKIGPLGLLSEACRANAGNLALADEHIADLHLPTAFKQIPSPPLTQEKLTTTKKAGELLFDIYKTLTPEEQDTLARQTYSSQRCARKTELPLLRSDHDDDVRQFQKAVKDIRDDKVNITTLPIIPVETDKDEGLDFPTKAYEHGINAVNRIVTEKPDVEMRRDILMRLQQALDRSWTEADDRQLWCELHAPTRPALRSITPPLSRRAVPFEPFVLDADDGQIPLSSTPSSRLSEDIAALEQEAFGEDKVSCIESDEVKHLVGLESKSATPSETLQEAVAAAAKDTVQEHSRPTQAKKLETPLLPIDTVVEAEEIDLAELAIPQVASDACTQDEFDTLISSDLLHTFEALAGDADKALEQEQLLPSDTKARLPLPIVDFSQPKPSWRKLNGAAEILSQIREEDPQLWVFKQWRLDRAKEKDLRWAPVMNVPGIDFDEAIETNDSLMTSLFAETEKGNVPTSSDYVWKRACPAILDNEDDDEEVSPRVVKERRNERSAHDRKGKAPIRSLWTSSTSRLPTKEASTKPDTSGEPQTCDGAKLLGSGAAGGHGRLLDNFLALRGSKRRRIAIPSPPQEPEAGNETALVFQPPSDVQILPASPKLAIALPEVPPRVVISHMLNRRVRPALERLVPGIDLVERDWSAHNTFIWLPGSAHRAEKASTLADEADIVVSPATGIMLTTLVKVRQKPMPGTGGLSLLRRHIQRTSLRYERLFVLVSEANVDGEVISPMSPSDTLAFTDFQSFLQSLDAEAVAYLVGGAEQTLANWAAALVCRYCHEALQVRHALEERENKWELFLRRAGLNAFAAQAMVMLTRAPDGMPRDQWSSWGLIPFVQMSPDQRAKIFKRVFGGRRVLDRVGARIDDQWPALAEDVFVTDLPEQPVLQPVPQSYLAPKYVQYRVDGEAFDTQRTLVD